LTRKELARHLFPVRIVSSLEIDGQLYVRANIRAVLDEFARLRGDDVAKIVKKIGLFRSYLRRVL